MYKTFIGIDPGKVTGGIGYIGPLGVHSHATPTIGPGQTGDYDENAMCDLLRDLEKPIAHIEKVVVTGREGASSLMATARGFWLWWGMLVALKIPRVQVRAQDWQAEMHKGTTTHKSMTKAQRDKIKALPPAEKRKAEKAYKDARRKTLKANSIIVAKRLFPDVSLRPSDASKVDHDGMAEALLIAEYGRRQSAGGTSA